MRSILWLLAAVGCVILLVSAVYYKDNKKCKGIQVEILGDNLNYFVNKNDVYKVVKKYGCDTTLNNPIASINLKQIEIELEKIIWIQDAELFFNSNNVLKISVKESLPIARVFTTFGNSFYIDSVCKVLPVNPKFSANVPVITGFKSLGAVLNNEDSTCLKDLKHISLIIIKDTFLYAMVEQINILPDNTYEIIPKIGNQIILLGNAKNVWSKFEKLKLFYKKVTPVVGWNKYSRINLQYENQIVTSIKGIEEAASDSIRTLELMKFVAENAEKKSSDSSQVFEPDHVAKTEEKSIEQSAEREDEGEEGNVNTVIGAVKKSKITMPVPSKTVAKKPVAPSMIIKSMANQKLIKPPIKPNETKPLATKPINKLNTVIKKPVIKQATKPATKPIKKSTVKQVIK